MLLKNDLSDIGYSRSFDSHSLNATILKYSRISVIYTYIHSKVNFVIVCLVIDWHANLIFLKGCLLAFATVTLDAVTDSRIILHQEGSDEAVSKALSRNFLQSRKQDVSLAPTDRKARKTKEKNAFPFCRSARQVMLLLHLLHSFAFPDEVIERNAFLPPRRKFFLFLTVFSIRESIPSK